MNKPNIPVRGGNAAHVVAQQLDASLPDYLKTIRMAPENPEFKMFTVVQNKSSVATPLSSRELYHEMQVNENTCGLHALRHYVGTQWISLDCLNMVNQGSEAWHGAIDAECADFEKIANGKELQAFLQQTTYPGNEEWQKQNYLSALGDIRQFAAYMAREKAASNRKGVLEYMESIKGVMTDYERVPLPQAPNPLSIIDGCISRVRDSINLTDISNGNGADPTVIRNALAKIAPEAKFVNPKDLGLDGENLNLSNACRKLDTMKIDRAIVCGNGHFITLRKTVNDGWCNIDSEKKNVISLAMKGRERSSIEGNQFYGIILSSEKNLANTLANQLVHY
jgi:hypothetical protein